MQHIFHQATEERCAADGLDIGFIVLGNMGNGMAANLFNLNTVHQVTAYNRSPDKAGGLIQQSTITVRTAAEARSGAVVVYHYALQRPDGR